MTDHRSGSSSTERAYTMIRQMVVEFRLHPHERINEVQMAREFSLSRTPVREALNRLATEGFLSFVPNRGFFFRPPNIEELVQIYEARSVLEQGAFALSCKRASPAQVRTLEQFWQQALLEYRQRNPDRILELDESFHTKLMMLCGNQELVRQLVALNARIRFARRLEIDRGPRHDSMIAAHGELIAALRSRAAVRGQKLLSAHIAMSVEDASAVLKEAVFKVFIAARPASAA